MDQDLKKKQGGPGGGPGDDLDLNFDIADELPDTASAKEKIDHALQQVPPKQTKKEKLAEKQARREEQKKQYCCGCC